MKKEKITLESIKQDFLKIAKWQISNKAEWRFSYIVPIILLSIIFGMLWKNIFVSLIIFSVAVYHIVKFITEYKKLSVKKAAIVSLVDRGEISVSTEAFSHIATEKIYEPHNLGKRAHTTKTIKKYYFVGGVSWREPIFMRHYDMRHYEWSRNFPTSTKGLENISIAGDEFLYVSLQEYPDIAYVYPCNFFELDASLII